MSFPMAPKSVTLNDLKRRNGRYFALMTWLIGCRFGTHTAVMWQLADYLLCGLHNILS